MNIIQLDLFDGKACIKCGAWKALDQFHRNSTTQDGRIGTCKACMKIYRDSLGTKPAELVKQWRLNNPERHRENGRRYARNHYVPHPRIRTRKGAEERRAYMQTWNARNIEKRAAIRQAYRARRRQAGGRVTAQQWRNLCAKYGDRCLCCGQARPLTMDHVIPLSKGGTHTIDNMQPLCGSCNSSKYDKVIDYRP